MDSVNNSQHIRQSMHDSVKYVKMCTVMRNDDFVCDSWCGGTVHVSFAHNGQLFMNADL